MIFLIESVVHKLFGGHGHSHFPSQEFLVESGEGDEVRGKKVKLKLSIQFFRTQIAIKVPKAPIAHIAPTAPIARRAPEPPIALVALIATVVKAAIQPRAATFMITRVLKWIHSLRLNNQ